MANGDVSFDGVVESEMNAGNLTGNIFLFPSLDVKKLIASLRIVFGAIFLIDGILKWYLLATGQMQGVITNSPMIYYTPAWLTANWFLFGVTIALGETFGGVFLILGIFQRPAAAWSFAIMISIWIFGGFGGFPNAMGASWNTAQYTDLGGDLMLGLVYLFLIFMPITYSLSSYLHLSERFASGNTLKDKLVRAVIL